MFNKSPAVARKLGTKLAIAVAFLAAAGAASAQTSTNPIVQLLNEIGLDGVQAAVLAVCVTIIGIALTMKGPDVSKRVIRKV